MKLRLPLLVLLSAGLFALALPNELFLFGNPLLGLLCAVPLFVAVINTSSYASASRLGLLFGAASTILANFWLWFFQNFAFWTLGGVTLGYMGYYALFLPILRRTVLMPRRYRPFLIAAAWTGFEYLKSIGFLGYPWGLIAYPVSGFLPLVQIADVTGLWGVSYIMALLNALLAETLLELPFGTAARPAAAHARTGPVLHAGQPSSSPLPHQAAMAAVLLVLILGYGAWRLERPIPVETTVRMVLVQQNDDPWAGGREVAGMLRGIELSDRGIRETGGEVDLVVWSESSLRRPFEQNPRFYSSFPEERPFLSFIRESGTFFLLGNPVILDLEERSAMNGAILVSPDGEVAETYGKIHPVPFAEAVPFWELEEVRSFFQNVIGLQAVWTMGDRYTIFRLPLRSGETVGFAVPICFEDAFPDLCRTMVREGADLLVNITNDSWSRMDSAQTQHFVAARFRAVENRRTLVRSTNSGVTAVVDAWGRTIASLPSFRADVLPVNVPVYREETYTVYTALGDYFPTALIALLFVLLLQEYLRERRGGRRSPGE